MADMKLNRRSLLQQAGLTLLSLGIAETGIGARVPRIKSYLQALGQTTNRKLALLVGINEYSQQYHLDGCLTDVELQQELLINRFGFNPKDILVLTNQQATRENIETAFVEHLTEQAQAEDVVVFHFSGYGNRVKISADETLKEEATTANYQLVDSLLPVDGILPTKRTPVANDFLTETLIWLARSLATEKITMVLDTSFSNFKQPLLGNLRIRSLADVAEGPSPEEIAFLKQLQLKLAGKKGKSTHPGIILAAASLGQVAVEKHWNNFSAGLFTYALTQYLWQVSSPSRVQVTMQRTAETVRDFMGNQQQPVISGESQPLFTYYSIPISSTGAEGIIKKIDNNGVISLKLTGLPVKVIDYYGVNSCLIVLPTDSFTSSTELTLIQIRSKDGLLAKAQLLNRENILENIKEGQLVQEYIRVINRNLGLVVAFDSSLERIERVDATSGFANISTVVTTIVVGESNADCLFGKIKKTTAKEIVANQGETEKTFLGYGLFSTSGNFIPHTVGTDNEAAKSAVARLTPQFKNLLAAKWLELTFNQTSSRLPTGISLESIGKDKSLLILQRATRAAESLNQLSSKDLLSATEVDFPKINTGSQLDLQLNNYSDRTLYGIILGIDSDRNLFVLYPPQYNKNEEQFKLQDIAIVPNQKLSLPETKDSWQWKVAGSSGIFTIYGIFSTLPFRQTLAAISAPPNLKFESEAILNLANPLEVAKAMLQDLHQASGVGTEIIGSATDVYALDVNAWATLKMSWELTNN
jgi:hypothetical protein